MYRDLTGERKVERLVLREGVTRRDVIRYAATQPWVALGTNDRTEHRLFQYVWRTEDGGATVFYLEDEKFGYQYMEVEGERQDAVEAVTARMAGAGEALPVIGDDEVGRRFEAAFAESGERDDKIGAAYLVALTSPPDFAPLWMRRFERAATDADPDARRAAVFAMSQAGWPEFRPLLERLAEEDPDSGVRDAAARLAGLMEKKFGATAA